MHFQHSPHDPGRSTTTVTTTPPLRGGEFQLKRRRWPGLLAAAIVGAGLAAAAVSSYYDDRSLGAKLDATAENTALAADRAAGRVAGTFNDAAITTAVKTALAADPSLSVLKIEVTTTDGVVLLGGPAPDTKSRDRAEMLALAPAGVVRVDNRLVVAAPTSTPVATTAAPTTN